MKTHSKILRALAAILALSAALPQRVEAVSDEEFNALKDLVTKQGQRIDQLEKTHDQDQKTHRQDQQQIQQLKEQLGETQMIATNAQQKAEAVAQAQPAHVMPGEGNATHNFALVGDAEIQFGKTAGQHSAFFLADYAPIFLYRANDDVLFEAGFDFMLQNNPSGGGSTTAFDLSFATLDYLFNDYATFVGGYMLLPLGTYSERSAGWLNKFPDNPLARDFLPGAGAGVQLRGAVPIGQSGQSVTYSVYGANGPSSIDGTGTALQAANGSPNLDLGGNVGLNSDGSFNNLHANPSGGGRIGWFYPLKPHYDLELGISGQAGEWDNAGNRLWSAFVVDAALHVSPFFEAKGEYINTWQETDDVGTLRPRGWWVQAGYKLAGLSLELPVVNNVELVTRYDGVHDDLGTTTDRFTMGYVYYFSNTLWFEGDYEFIHSRGPNAILAPNQWVLQLSYGF